MTLLSKEEHPIRKVGLGGKINKTLTDISASTVDRAVTEFLRNNCKPEYMTVGIEVGLLSLQPKERNGGLVEEWLLVAGAEGAWGARGACREVFQQGGSLCAWA
jgi:hypothetical protein